MPTPSHNLPITKTLEPTDVGQLVEIVRGSHDDTTAIYPIGGGTSLDFGLPAKRSGLGLSLAKLNRVIDFPARDMTITVETGLTLQSLSDVLAKERQLFPCDVPHRETATIGGLIATNFNGPRRYGLGAIRDLVIGISAVDGRGAQFKGGGRVVKNVAGYDFCKLLTGSLGTLGIITQVTLRLKPLAEASVLVACPVADAVQAETLLATLAKSEVTPTAIELVSGPAWQAEPTLSSLAAAASPSSSRLIVGLEGTQVEVAWMTNKLLDEWRAVGVAGGIKLEEDAARTLWKKLAEFPQAGDSPLVLKASVVPSGVARVMDAARDIDPACSLQAHAGNGVVIVRLSKFPAAGLARTVVAKLQTVAHEQHGSVIILSNPSGAETTSQSVWDGGPSPFGLMTSVKKQFDPRNILNPDRFVYV